MSMNIFEKLNNLLVEAENNSNDKNDKGKIIIPIHPERETKDQGKIAAYEKIFKLYQRLVMGGGGPEGVNQGPPPIPDDLIDPMLKNPPTSIKDKIFEINKLVGWDEDEDEKIEKEIETIDNDDKNDDFDDFDYRDNEFDDDDDDKSEDEKLKDSIKDAIDSLNNENQQNNDGEDGDDSGADWGDEDNTDGSGSKQQSAKQKRLNDLMDALNSGDDEGFDEAIEDVKNITEDSKDNNVKQPGGKMESPTDNTIVDEMKKIGMNKESINKIIQQKNTNSKEQYSEEEEEELVKNVIDSLEKRCKDKSNGSSLANSIVSNAAKRVINTDEWKEMLKIFLNKKSIRRGKTSNSNKEITFNNKNSLWRKTALPTINGQSEGAIQTINCFVDFSSSVNRNLVFHFLGEVINLCVKLKYTDVKVYGFSDHLSVPRTINKKTISEGVNDIEEGIKLAIDETWKFLEEQNLGNAEEFKNVAEEINKIKKKEQDAVFLVFGDAEWGSIKNLKKHINRDKYLKDICMLVYYTEDQNTLFRETIYHIVNYVGINHIIVSKAKSIIKQ